MADPGEKGQSGFRGKKNPNAAGVTTFVGLRAIEPVFQYGVLANGLGGSIITALGGSVLSPGAASNTGISLLDTLGLSPYRLALLGMTVGASAKHIFWRLFIGEEDLGIGPSVFVGWFNGSLNTINHLLFVCAATSAARYSNYAEGPSKAPSNQWPPWTLLVGGSMVVAGILVEAGSEIQRKLFKRKPESLGKPYTKGLFGLARHINYTGYTLWRGGMAMAACGPLWSATTTGLFLCMFSYMAIPELDTYCQNKYADLWNDYKTETPYKLIPYVY